MELYKYQKQAANAAYLHGNSHMLLCECGTGKTTIELSVIAYRLKKGYIKKCLIIAPYSILWTSWESDIKKFYPEITYEIFWHAEAKSRLEMISSFNKQVAIINYEVVKKYYHKIMDLQFDMIVLDESTRIKNHASWTTKNILSLGYTIKYKSIMTATPGHIPEHYWAQLSFIDVINESFSRFRDTFCSKVELGDTGMSKYVPRQEMFDTLRNVISSKAVRLTKKECLELPEKTFIVREVALPDKAFSLYKEMEDESVVEINNEVIMAQFPGVLAQKLRQIANGMLYSHETGSRHRIHDAKLKEVDDIIDRVDGQVIIWANFTEDISVLAERYDALTFYGATIDKRQSHEDFVSGKKKVIVCHPMSAGHGITWVNCNVVIYYSLPPLEHFLQSQDRVHRIGQRNPCTYYIINANSTVDKTIWNCLQKNQDYQNELINFARSILKSYNTDKGALCYSDVTTI